MTSRFIEKLLDYSLSIYMSYSCLALRPQQPPRDIVIERRRRNRAINSVELNRLINQSFIFTRSA